MKKSAKASLKDLKVKPSKERGQNFVIDPELIEEIVRFGHPAAGDTIVEVGPGLGALTDALSRFPKLTLIEIEERFVGDLQQRFPAVNLIHNDVRAVDFSDIGSDLIVFGNLPYSFSTDIIFHLIENRHVVDRAVLLLQREFVDRMIAPPGGRTYGALSVGVQLWSSVRAGAIVPGDSFHPPTRVESRLVELTFHNEPRVPVKDSLWFRRVVQAAFQNRRRTLANSLRSSQIRSDLKMEEVLKAAEIDASRRAETLSLEEFARLADHLEAG